MKYYKTIQAGRLRRSIVYTAPSRQDRRERSPQCRVSSQAQQRLNLRRSVDKLEALLAANFDAGFWWVTLTYDDEHLPEDRAGARKLLAKYIRKLRIQWRRKGTELRYVYCTQEILDDGSSRLHHHMVLNKCDRDDFDQIRSLWTYGSNIDIQWLHSDDDITDKAIYMTHEPRDHGKPRVGEQTWTPSRGLIRPEESEPMPVPDEVTLEAPVGARIVERDAIRSEWGEFSYIKYWLPRSDSGGTNFNPRGRY